jgi:hypothetical protein
VSGAAAASGGASGAAVAGSGMNPFYQVTNLFAQQNYQGQITSYQLGASTLPGGGQINPGNFLRGLRLQVRTITAGATQTTQADGPYILFLYAGLQNVDGSEILYNVLSGYEYYLAQFLFRPWLMLPSLRASYAYNTTTVAFDMFLQPEVRQQLGVLENTDSRSQYQWSQTINTEAAVVGAAGTSPTLSILSFIDTWAQPDGEDLEQTPNQQIPEGANLQTKLRHQTFTAAAAGGSNTFLSTLTGNAVRGQVLIFRDGSNVRQDGLSNPIQWQLDQRNLSSVAPDQYFRWAEDFYSQYYAASYVRPTGVYPFPRYYNPGEVYGQGWLYTANSTAESWSSSTAAGISGTGTVTLLQEEVYATGPVDPTLIDL